MAILLTCKNEEDPIKNNNIMHPFFRRARADNSGVGGNIWPKFELIQAFMHVLFACKNEVDQIKNEGARFLPL